MILARKTWNGITPPDRYNLSVMKTEALPWKTITLMLTLKIGYTIITGERQVNQGYLNFSGDMKTEAAATKIQDIIDFQSYSRFSTTSIKTI